LYYLSLFRSTENLIFEQHKNSPRLLIHKDVKRIIVKDIHDQLLENKWVKLSSKKHEIKRTTFQWHFPENTIRKQEMPSLVSGLDTPTTHTNTSRRELETPSLHQLWYVSNRQTHPHRMPELWQGQKKCWPARPALQVAEPRPTQR